MLFSELKIIPSILSTLKNEGYTEPTPIQAKAIPVILSRKDVLACAQTGTGKTAAFSIPLLQLLHLEQAGLQKFIKVLILTPTRELAIQIKESIDTYGHGLHIKNTVVYGGVGQESQVAAIRRGVDILIATPGRLLDLIQQGHISIKQIKHFVLDEADRMLDMGFLNDVRKIIAYLPIKRQTLLFSATMPDEIAKLANSILHQPVEIKITPVSSTVNTIEQKVFYIDKSNKKLLLKQLIHEHQMQNVLVFSKTKHGANRIAKELMSYKISAEAIHGNKSQTARQQALNNFKSKKTKVLVATDIAARGIDIDDLKYVINYDLPQVEETYVHRIGRTGRAGNEGTAFTFCDATDFPLLKDIEKLINKKINLVPDHPYHIELTHSLAKQAVKEKLQRMQEQPKNRIKKSRSKDHSKDKKVDSVNNKDRNQVVSAPINKRKKFRPFKKRY